MKISNIVPVLLISTVSVGFSTSTLAAASQQKPNPVTTVGQGVGQVAGGVVEGAGTVVKGAGMVIYKGVKGVGDFTGHVLTGFGQGVNSMGKSITKKSN